MPVVYRSFDDSVLSAIGDGAVIEAIFETLVSKKYVDSDDHEYAVCDTSQWKRKARRILFLSQHIHVRLEGDEAAFHIDEDYTIDAIVTLEESPDTIGSIRTLESSVIATLMTMKSGQPQSETQTQAHTSPASKREPAETQSESEDEAKDGQHVDDMFLQKTTEPLKKRRME